MSIAFQTQVDIANRALQHVGMTRILTDFTEDSRQASECAFIYDKLRRAELQRNVWKFAIKKTALRAIDKDTKLISPSLWSPTTTYAYGALVIDVTGLIWQSRIQSNLNNNPTDASSITSYAWEVYCGPDTAMPYDTSGTTNYYAGEIVYKTPGDGTYTVYLSTESGNSLDPETTTTYDATVTYSKNDVVVSSAINYVSLVDFNMNNTPASSPTLWTTVNPFGTAGITWITLEVALVDLKIVYPVGTGPVHQSYTRNVYRVPAGFIRQAPQDPKAGSISYLGSPGGLRYTDWTYEGKYITSTDTFPVIVRYVGDVSDVSLFDDMFCELLAAHMGLMICEPLTQSTSKLQTIAGIYKQFGSDARTINGIETGPTESPEDDWLTTRL